MDLTLQKPGDHLFIRAVSEQGIQVQEQWYQGPLIISADQLITDWPASDFDSLNAALLRPVLELQADVVLIGTGDRQRFLSPELSMGFYQRGQGVEVMTTQAACRTFNVLVSEERRVAAALLPVSA